MKLSDMNIHRVSKKRPAFGLLQLWHMWTDFDIFWQKCYR